jgi:uncharacterized membrane protein
MEQADTAGAARGSGGAFVFHSRPRCSLTRAGERLVFTSLAALCLAVAIVFAARGYWPVLPFAGVELAFLAWALKTLRSRAHDFESLTVDGDSVVLTWRCGRHTGRRTMNRQWVRVVCECSARGRNCRLCLRSHGRETEVGLYLSDEARLHLAASLIQRLQGTETPEPRARTTITTSREDGDTR